VSDVIAINDLQAFYFKMKEQLQIKNKELDAKDDAKKITNLVKEILTFEEIKTFYNDVRKFHFPGIEKILNEKEKEISKI